MPENNTNNQTRSRLDASRSAKPLPRLSLSLHTMPSQDEAGWKKWLVLGLLAFLAIALALYFVFSQ